MNMFKEKSKQYSYNSYQLQFHCSSGYILEGKLFQAVQRGCLKALQLIRDRAQRLQFTCHTIVINEDLTTSDDPTASQAHYLK